MILPDFAAGNIYQIRQKRYMHAAMAHPCADNSSSFLFYHPPASCCSDTSDLMAIAQQLLQKQHHSHPQHHRPSNCMEENQWQSRVSATATHHLSLPTSKSACGQLDEVEDSSSSSFFCEPTSVLDHLSPSLDSMYSPLSLPEQRLHDTDQCLQDNHLCLTDNPPLDRLTDYSNILNEDDDFCYKSEDFATLSSTYCLGNPQSENAMADHERDDGSAEWVACLMSDLQEEAREEGSTLSCFDHRNMYTESAKASTPWQENFSFACGADDPPSLPPYACQADLPSDAAHFLPSHFLLLPTICSPSDLPTARSFESRDAFSLLSSAGLLGMHLQRKGGDRGVRLLQLLIDCIKQLDKNTTLAGSGGGSTLICKSNLLKLRELSSAYGDPMQRLAIYFADAIHARLKPPSSSSSSPSPSPSLSSAPPVVSSFEDGVENQVMAFRILNEACPYIKFAHLTANQAILEAAERTDKLHIIDCGIVQGVQWASLLQAFATTRSTSGATLPRIKITAIASPSLGTDPSASLAATGKRLSDFATLLSIHLEFYPVCTHLEDLHPSMLRLDPNEVIAVNFMFQLHHLLDDSSLHHLQRALSFVQLLSPAVITVSEYEASINAPSLQARFINTFCFYAALFDSLDATMGREDPERAMVEGQIFAKEINSLMSEGGKEQTAAGRRESSENWRRVMERAGFWNKAVSQYASHQARLLLWLYCQNFTLMEGPGCLSLGWLEHPIVTVSAWHC